MELKSAFIVEAFHHRAPFLPVFPQITELDYFVSLRAVLLRTASDQDKIHPSLLFKSLRFSNKCILAMRSLRTKIALLLATKGATAAKVEPAFGALDRVQQEAMANNASELFVIT